MFPKDVLDGGKAALREGRASGDAERSKTLPAGDKCRVCCGEFFHIRLAERIVGGAEILWKCPRVFIYRIDTPSEAGVGRSVLLLHGFAREQWPCIDGQAGAAKKQQEAGSPAYETDRFH